MFFNREHKFRRNIYDIVEDADLDNYKKKILMNRYVKQVVYYERKSDRYRKHYNTFRTSVTIGSILLPALLSIQNVSISSNDDDKSFQQIIYWVTWGISLGVTVCNGIIQLFSLDKLYFSSSMVMEKLKSEGWQFFQLSGRYIIYNTHNEAFIEFCTQIEKLKMEQVTHEYSELKQDNKDDDTSTITKPTEGLELNGVHVMSKEQIQQHNEEVNSQFINNTNNLGQDVHEKTFSKKNSVNNEDNGHVGHENNNSEEFFDNDSQNNLTTI